MRIFYDTEFIDDGRTIDLISIGMVADDGREYYAVSNQFNINALLANPWLVDNVLPSLPRKEESGPGQVAHVGRFDWMHPDVKNRDQIASEVSAFVGDTPDPVLWAWYAAYDHVALAQLFGRMITLPAHMPMYTCDLKQECVRLGDPRVPKQAEGLHNALQDARHNRVIATHLDELAARGRP